MIDIAQLGLEVRSDGVVVATDRLDKMEKAGKRAQTASDRLNKEMERLGRTLGRMAALGVTALAGMTANSIRLAVAAEETASKFQVVFRGSVERANAQLVEMSKTIPLTVTQMRGLSSGVQDMLVPMGLARKEAAGLSVEAVRLAGDIASFNNVKADQVLENIQSALAGSSEPLRKFGIDVREGRLQAIALEKGLIGVGDELNSTARAQAVFAAITADSSDAMGDAERTMDSTANQLRFMRRDMRQAQEDLGQLLIPAFADLLSSLNEVDEDGLTPIQRTMQSLSVLILRATQGIILMSVGWKQLKKSIEDVLDLVPEGGGDLFAGLITQNSSQIGSGLSQLFNTDLDQHLDEAAAAREERNRQFLAEVERQLAAFDNAGQAIETILTGVDRTLDDVRGGAEEAGGAMEQAFDPAALADLLAILDPTTKALGEFRKARKLLEDARGSIGEEEFQRLLDLLWRSDLAMRAFADRIGEFARVDITALAELEANFAWLDQLDANADALDRFRGAVDPTVAKYNELAKAIEQLNKIKEESPELFAEGEFDRLVAGLERVIIAAEGIGAALMQSADITRDVFRDLQKGLGRESEYFDALTVAIEATNIVKAIGAILAQGQGDPYSAPARMAAMAALVSSIIGTTFAVGNLGGNGYSNLAQERQDAQGTGSVLGDTAAKTESILNASEITADATSELVGINRGMLHALQSLQQGIEGAVIQLSRGAGDLDFGALPGPSLLENLIFGTGPFDILGINFIGDFLQSIFGSKSELVDQGVEILGGTLDEILIRGFQSIAVKKHIFDDTDLEERFQDLDESVQQQFGLIFDSIEDTVREAALALGLPLDVIDERIAAFVVETQKISLKDLDADEQREELLAVFGRIFDDLASHVIPYIDQFQQVGEGLGETLVRVATSVQVFQEAVNQLGFAADLSDPELVAQMAVGLVELTGGVSEFISQFTTFMDKFASDEQKLAFATEQLNSAFAQADLVVPATSEGMWELMQSLDATTEEGREQIATLLRLSDVASDYYNLLEEAEKERAAAAQAVYDEALANVQLIEAYLGTGPSSELRALVDRFDEAMAAADALGASTREYAMIMRSFDRQLQRMAAELTLRIITLTQQLFGSQVQQGITEPISAGVEETREIANSLFTDWQRALSNLREYTQSLLLNETLSPLTPAERLAEAQSQFDALLQAALAGDVDAAGALPDAARELLNVARFMYASGAQYQTIFDYVLSALDSVQMPSGIPETITETFGAGTGVAPPPLTPIDLVAQALERTLLAMDLAETLRDLALVLDTSVIQLAQELGIPLHELVALLGVELDNLSNETAMALASAAELLGADVFELAEAVGISLTELAEVSGVHLDNMSQALVAELRSFADELGVNVIDLADRLGVSIDDLAETFGVSVDNFEAAHFQALVDFSDAIGLSITEVTETLGLSLGNIADATSILSQSLDLAIAELPGAIQADLGPMLEAIRSATTQADANLAIQNLGNYVLGLPPDIAAALMPFLELIGFQEQTPELTALQQIVANTAAIADAIGQIGNININIPQIVGAESSSSAPGAPATNSWVYDPTHPNGGYWSNQGPIGGFHTGGWVNRTGLYQMHADEFVVNRSGNNLIIDPPQSDPVVAAQLTNISASLEEIKRDAKNYQNADLQTSKDMASGIRDQGERLRRRGGGCG